MKIKVKNKTYEVTLKTYDPYYECYLYYTKEFDIPFCDLDDNVEVIYDEIH